MGFWDFLKNDCEIKFSNLQKQFTSVNNAKNKYSELLQTCQKNLNSEIVENSSLTKKVSELQSLISGETDENEVYWNSRYPKQDISYWRQEKDGEYKIDVRCFFQKDYQTSLVQGNSNDEKAFNAQKWVYDNITYLPDKINYGFDEFWAYAYQTLKRKKGDCEDGAILMANMLIMSGVPYWRIRLNAGDVLGGAHVYVTYCRETDNQWVVLDWCYDTTFVPIATRALHRDVQDYYGIWFSWNNRYSFGKMDTMLGAPKGDFVYG